MARLIDADALLAEVMKNNVCQIGDCIITFDYGAAAAINNAPTIDAEPVRHGRWIKTRKHIWKKNDDGEIDEWAWDYEFHNGVCCEICHKSPCIHCEPDYDEKQDCREHYICSECGRMVLAFEPYCHCGAKMDGGAENG